MIAAQLHKELYQHSLKLGGMQMLACIGGEYLGMVNT